LHCQHEINPKQTFLASLVTNKVEVIPLADTDCFHIHMVQKPRRKLTLATNGT